MVMNNFRKLLSIQILCLLLSLFFSMQCYAANAISIQQGIENILAGYNEDLDLGIVVQSMDSGEILYQHNAQQLFSPASTFKLFTAYAALSYLGPDYHFQTQLLTDAKQAPIAHQLNGNLYIKFTGDPELKLNELNQLFASIANTTVHGKVLIDDTRFDQQGNAPGWKWDEQQLCYAAPISALILNHNCFSFQLIPAKHAGSPSHINSLGTPLFASISNSVITSKAYCPLNLETTDRNLYRISGCIAPRKTPVAIELAITDPHAYGKAAIIYLLQKNHVTAHAVDYQKAADNLLVLNTLESRPLSALVKTMLKKSDNLIADALFKTLGAAYYQQTGTWENSSKALQQILISKTHIDFSNAVIYDGAGLSRYTLITPQQFTALLNAAYHDPQLASTFIAALPVAGIDGTLKYRMGKGLTLGNIHAKTGSLSDTSALSGYLKTNRNEVLAFTIIVNRFTESLRKYHVLQDKICQLLVGQDVVQRTG